MHLVEQLMKIALLGSEWVLYLLLILSVFSLMAAVERWWFFYSNGRRSRGLRAALSSSFAAGQSDVAEVVGRFDCLEGQVLLTAWKYRDGGPAGIMDAIEGELRPAREELETGLTFLGTVGNNAPFVGLFGTVLGVIAAFQHLGEGGEASMGLVMGGIAEALIATGVGIFVAIPAVVAYNVAQARVGLIEGEIVALGRLLCAHLRTQEARSGARRDEARRPASQEG
jgi:biopolymer transport protein ExbB/TolQ